MATYTYDQPYYSPSNAKWGGHGGAKDGWLPWAPGGGGGPGVTLYFMNKVWDPRGGGPIPMTDGLYYPAWVRWETEDAPDPTGAFYPDPWGSGFGACSFYRVEAMRYA